MCGEGPEGSLSPDAYPLLAWAPLQRAAAPPPAREREHCRALPLIQAERESGAIQTGAPPALILMSVMALATAWSPAFPFGTAANPATGLSPGTIRSTITDVGARIVGHR
jgi:hypothetical protein